MPPLQRGRLRPAQVLTLAIFLGAAAPLGLSCGSSGGEGASGTTATATASATASASEDADADDSAKPRKKEDDVRPLYPNDGSPPDPLAQRFCAAIHDLEPKRRAECCGAPGASGHFTGECARVLSAAIRLNAVKLDAAAVDGCVNAVSKGLDGCGWVGPAAPDLPAECDAVITGLVAEQAVCRSSLECEKGLACQGLSATQKGKCFGPKPAGVFCGGTVDTLAAMTLQHRTGERHPECAGVCTRPICVDLPPAGGACKANAECGTGRSCVSGKCTDQPLPGAGKPCAASECARGVRCVKGTCVAPKPEGEACALDAECAGGCEKPQGAAAGKCGKRCAVQTIPTKPAFTPKAAPQPTPGR
jgi:hypothetical protein